MYSQLFSFRQQVSSLMKEYIDCWEERCRVDKEILVQWVYSFEQILFNNCKKYNDYTDLLTTVQLRLIVVEGLQWCISGGIAFVKQTNKLPFKPSHVVASITS